MLQVQFLRPADWLPTSEKKFSAARYQLKRISQEEVRRGRTSMPIRAETAGTPCEKRQSTDLSIAQRPAELHVGVGDWWNIPDCGGGNMVALTNDSVGRI